MLHPLLLMVLLLELLMIRLKPLLPGAELILTLSYLLLPLVEPYFCSCIYKHCFYSWSLSDPTGYTPS